MNKYIRKLGFRSADEMEMKVTLKAIKFSWLYVMAFVAVWSVLYAMNVNISEPGEIPFVHIMLIITAYMLYFALQWFFTRQAIKENRKKHSTSKRVEGKGKGKHSYEYVYEDEHRNQYVYDESEENK